MKKGFKPIAGADGWQVSNVPVFQAAAHLASLELFEQAGMKALRKKSILLTGYLEFLLRQTDPDEKYFQIITPPAVDHRGCQLSVFLKRNGEAIFRALTRQGVVIDWREPGVIRLAPVPLYNTFEEVYAFAQILKKLLHSHRS
jgi:kynureninase